MATLSSRDRRARIEIELEHVQPAARLGVDGGVVDAAAPAAAEPLEQNVLADREARDEVALLMHHADAGGDRIARPGEADRRSVQPQLAFVRPMDAGDDLDQRRFARAVLAEQRVDGAAAHRRSRRPAAPVRRETPCERRGPRARSRHVTRALAARWKLHFAQPVDADRPQDQQAEHHLDEERIDAEDHQRLRDDRDDDDAEERAEDADMAAGERGAADHRRGERQDQPIVADRGLAELQPRDQHHAGERGEEAGQAVRPKDRARDRDARKFGRVRIAADGEDVAPDLLAIEQTPHADDDQRGGQREPGNRARRSWRCRTPSRWRGCRRTAARA